MVPPFHGQGTGHQPLPLHTRAVGRESRGARGVQGACGKDHRIQATEHRSGRKVPARAAASMQCRPQGLGPYLDADGPRRERRSGQPGALSGLPLLHWRPVPCQRSKHWLEACFTVWCVDVDPPFQDPRPGNQQRRFQSADSPHGPWLRRRVGAPPRARICRPPVVATPDHRSVAALWEHAPKAIPGPWKPGATCVDCWFQVGLFNNAGQVAPDVLDQG